MNEEVKSLTNLEMLYIFRNKHLEDYFKALIMKKYFANQDPNEVVATIIQQGQVNPGGLGVEKHIKAKEAQANKLKDLTREESILKVIDELIAKEKK